MDKRPDLTFEYQRDVVPGLSADWEPDFAASLFETHLIEWFYTEAKNAPPDTDGVVRN
jgi:hypothetical protein